MCTVHIKASLFKKHDQIATQLVLNLKQNKKKQKSWQKSKHDNLKSKDY